MLLTALENALIVLLVFMVIVAGFGIAGFALGVIIIIALVGMVVSFIVWLVGGHETIHVGQTPNRYPHHYHYH